MTDTETARSGPRRWRGLEPEDRRAARRAQLIEAGMQIMGTEGAAAATMRATCREAALTERYFYESFGSRDELLVAVLDEVVLGARDTILAALETAPVEPPLLIRHVVKAFTAYVTKDPRRGRIMFVESQAEPALWDRGRELMAEFTNPISFALEAMYGGEKRDAVNSELNSVGLFGALAFIYQAHTQSSKISRKRLVEHISLMIEAQARVNSTPAGKA
ncbi:TetR family transcriptional regulator [Rhodococcus sp. SRB_17]|uniref:TetR/AcrR family transcriptional regulator n=1 Tax=unclassified Rhodococcus (in: high G+C Gram-positive bacteria) TaxID=192944 RepID=UPI000B942404|nr:MULTISPECIES: TetR/AcrR family transcriptional regulator [unclassified Rhodococcus (in: high G+C Gram-positive bacteria)]MCJ0904974.1 TetR/AcrR family transcriptional regulator [Rhodococcus sp. ARC_M6]NMM86605.1 TetR family transcriptional regulator [Rhodococcus sp. SRB_17]OYD68362.1 TetR family transcriptional regulator [Rhodococcus sp. OK302]